MRRRTSLPSNQSTTGDSGMEHQTGWIKLGVFFLIMVGPSWAWGADDRAGIDFFESKIRPVLVKECYSCHSAESKSLKGGLRLDSRSGLLTGGDSGPAIVPGSPEESPLLAALRHEDIAMPPKSKLTPEVIADFERWIKMGMPDPRTEPAGKAIAKRTDQSGMSFEQGRQFWAYKLPVAVDPPAVSNTRWPINDIDRFVLAQLEAKHIEPVPTADKGTLIRRIYYGLMGLPPTPEEINAFVQDPSTDAYEALVDRLLASPHFGERWGRHWLDVVRYAESLTLRGLVLRDAWRYRDYVIDAFNVDRPYNQFLREQVAGDLLPYKNLDDHRSKLIATTFLSLGNTNLEEQDKRQLEMDVVDEQLDTIGKGFLAQTIGCARCHDHKFDPIPTRDYYAMAGILKNTKSLEHANVSKWLDRPLPVDPATEKTLSAFEKQVASLETELKSMRGKLGSKNGKGTKMVVAVSDLPGIVVDDTQAKRVGAWMPSQFSKSYIGEGYVHDMNESKGEKSLTFTPEIKKAGTYEVWLAYAPGGGRSSHVPVSILSADGDKDLHVDMSAAPPIDGRYVSLGKYRFESNGQGYVLISNEGTTGHVTADAILFLPTDGSGGAVAKSAKDADPETRRIAEQVSKLEKELKTMKADGPVREIFIGVEEVPKVEEIRVHVRGSVHSLGEPAPRGVLKVANYGPELEMPSQSSGRRELADWIAAERNPLTARVYVNRVWHWLFGAGLVRTTDNFGATGETPSHPELLDTLSVRFMNEGWSTKRLIREIVLSRTYQLASETSKVVSVDPENRLLWKGNRQRMDAECLLDTMWFISGELDQQMKGPGFPASIASDYDFEHKASRRSIYSPVFRNSLPELFEVFDFADPSMVVGHRNVSTIAPQALFLLNHPRVFEHAKAAASRLLSVPALDDQARVERLYFVSLGRKPTDDEKRIALEFLHQKGAKGEAGTPDEQAWALLYQAVFASVDFRYVN